MAFAITFVVRGYHVYKDIWAVEIVSELPCFVEPHNREDRYAVAVMDGDTSIASRSCTEKDLLHLLHIPSP